MKLEEKKLLTDVLLSVQAIDEHLQHKRDFNQYKTNKTMRRAVERELEIIGEAMSKLLKINSDITITNARLMVDLRNKVIHAYDNVNNIIIWKIINQNLPLLQQEVTDLLTHEI